MATGATVVVQHEPARRDAGSLAHPDSLAAGRHTSACSFAKASRSRRCWSRSVASTPTTSRVTPCRAKASTPAGSVSRDAHRVCSIRSGSRPASAAVERTRSHCAARSCGGSQPPGNHPSPRRPALRAAARLEPPTWMGSVSTPCGFGKLVTLLEREELPGERGARRRRRPTTPAGRRSPRRRDGRASGSRRPPPPPLRVGLRPRPSAGASAPGTGRRRSPAASPAPPAGGTAAGAPRSRAGSGSSTLPRTPGTPAGRRSASPAVSRSRLPAPRRGAPCVRAGRTTRNRTPPRTARQLPAARGRCRTFRCCS